MYGLLSTALDATPGQITTDMLSPITSTVGANITTLTPVGIGIMGMMIGVSLVPRVIYKFL